MPDTISPVCIGLPVRNGADYLPQALDSLLAQSFGDFEVVISDNASTDATAEICRDYGRRDRRVRYSRLDRDIGAAPNFNRTFAMCRAPLFKWMAHDDVLAPRWLERCVALLGADSGAVLAHTAVRMIGADGAPLAVAADGKVIDSGGTALLAVEALHLAEGDRPEHRFRDVLRRMTWCTACLGLIRSEALRRTHRHGHFYGGDMVLLAELALLGRFRQDPEPLFLKRCHPRISVHKDWRERARWADPAAPEWPGLRLRLAYLKALTVVPLRPLQRLSCLDTVARVSARNPLFRRYLPYGLRSLPLVGRWVGQKR
jgi:glycosyltransferase involved in cell wall biosynthesis